MKNQIVSIMFLLITILLLVSIFNGIRIGGFEILSVSQLKSKDSELSTKINDAIILTSIEYPETIDDLEETYEQYNVQKQKYEEISGFAEDEKGKIYETKQYDIGYLWELVGKYAKKYNLTIDMSLQKSNNQQTYDLNFKISGQYVNICEFIAQIENNSDLSFRIYNFKMNGSSQIISSSFTVKDVNIDSSTISSSAVKLQSEE